MTGSSNRWQARRRRPRPAPRGDHGVHNAANRARIARVAAAAARHGWYEVPTASLNSAVVSLAGYGPHVVGVRFPGIGLFRVVSTDNGAATLRKIGD